MTEVKIVMDEGCDDLFPTKAHEDDAAYDIRANGHFVVHPKSVGLVSTGIHIQLPRGYEAQIRPRSGLAAKSGISVLNTPGTIDCGYTGEVKVILFNFKEGEPFVIHKGDRIAQMVIQRLPEVTLVKADSLDSSDRGNGGFGSTGVK